MTDLMRAALVFTLVLLLGFGASLVSAQTPTEDTAEEPTAEEAKQAKQLEKERAKQARIEEYLRKKEERRARRDLERNQKEQEKATAAEAVEPSASSSPKAPKAKKPKARAYTGTLPKEMRRVQELLWEGPLGQDPTVRTYLERIDRGEASPQQIAAFGNFLGEAGMLRAAIAYYDLALEMEKDDALLWMNAGTLRRQAGEYSAASSAYSRSLMVDPNNAFAHYNLGAVMDEMGRYEEAVREYKTALTLDPSLGDPAVNPQAANNDRLLAVQLMLYQEQEGSLGLPLVAIPGGDLEDEGAGAPSDE